MLEGASSSPPAPDGAAARSGDTTERKAAMAATLHVSSSSGSLPSTPEPSGGEGRAGAAAGAAPASPTMLKSPSTTPLCDEEIAILLAFSLVKKPSHIAQFRTLLTSGLTLATLEHHRLELTQLAYNIDLWQYIDSRLVAEAEHRRAGTAEDAITAEGKEFDEEFIDYTVEQLIQREAIMAEAAGGDKKADDAALASPLDIEKAAEEAEAQQLRHKEKIKKQIQQDLHNTRIYLLEGHSEAAEAERIRRLLDGEAAAEPTDFELGLKVMTDKQEEIAEALYHTEVIREGASLRPSAVEHVSGKALKVDATITHPSTGQSLLEYAETEAADNEDAIAFIREQLEHLESGSDAHVETGRPITPFQSPRPARLRSAPGASVGRPVGSAGGTTTGQRNRRRQLFPGEAAASGSPTATGGEVADTGNSSGDAKGDDVSGPPPSDGTASAGSGTGAAGANSGGTTATQSRRVAPERSDNPYRQLVESAVERYRDQYTRSLNCCCSCFAGIALSYKAHYQRLQKALRRPEGPSFTDIVCVFLSPDGSFKANSMKIALSDNLGTQGPNLSPRSHHKDNQRLCINFVIKTIMTHLCSMRTDLTSIFGTFNLGRFLSISAPRNLGFEGVAPAQQDIMNAIEQLEELLIPFTQKQDQFDILPTFIDSIMDCRRLPADTTLDQLISDKVKVAHNPADTFIDRLECCF